MRSARSYIACAKWTVASTIASGTRFEVFGLEKTLVNLLGESLGNPRVLKRKLQIGLRGFCDTKR